MPARKETIMNRKPTEIKVCSTCRREVEVPRPSGGHPYGWYSISVNVPPGFSFHGQPYRWVGLYCSAQCIADAMPYIKEMRAKFSKDFAYE
jgi:hypothetical protein